MPARRSPRRAGTSCSTAPLEPGAWRAAETAAGATEARWHELSEEFDVRQGQLRGNLPRAFVHALLHETAVTLDGG